MNTGKQDLKFSPPLPLALKIRNASGERWRKRSMFEMPKISASVLLFFFFNEGLKIYYRANINPKSSQRRKLAVKESKI